MSDDSDDFDAVTQNAKNEEELAGVDQVLVVLEVKFLRNIQTHKLALNLSYN